MNDKYWEKFYKGKSIPEASPFAKFCEDKYHIRNKYILDIGAGDGRDTLFLSLNGGNITAVEPNNKFLTKNVQDIFHYNGSFQKFIKEDNSEFDIIYARWLIHAVDEKIEDMILDFAAEQKATLMLEFRIEGDVYDNSHKRRLIDPKEFFDKLMFKNFIIKHFEVGHGLSKQGDNDPYLARVIAEHKGR